jgi:aldehyde dehydrogenase (NAD+)
LDDADIEKAVTSGANHCFMNTGQSCNAPTRMLVSLKIMKLLFKQQLKQPMQQ